MEQHSIQQTNEKIEEVSRLSQIEIATKISNSDIVEEKREKLEELKGYQKAIYKARKLENNMAHKQRIEKNIQKRNNKMNGALKKIEDMIWKDSKLKIKMKIQKYAENNEQKTTLTQIAAIAKKRTKIGVILQKKVNWVRKAEEIQKKEPYKIREILEMTNWA
ncbi:34937_t:CDS:2, partial [Gigaspora margarita]